MTFCYLFILTVNFFNRKMQKTYILKNSLKIFENKKNKKNKKNKN